MTRYKYTKKNVKLPIQSRQIKLKQGKIKEISEVKL